MYTITITLNMWQSWALVVALLMFGWATVYRAVMLGMEEPLIWIVAITAVGLVAYAVFMIVGSFLPASMEVAGALVIPFAIWAYRRSVSPLPQVPSEPGAQGSP